MGIDTLWTVIGSSLIFGVAAAADSPQNAITHAREFETGPISISYDNLAALVAGTRDIIERANAAAEHDKYSRPTISLSVTAGEDSVKVAGWRPISDEKDLPPTARDVSFHYYWNSADPIADVSISLYDFQ